MKGEYKHSIDAKGRLAMPAKLREELGEHFTVTKGLDGCLSVYFANAFDAQLDAQGRILIPANLRTFAELQKDVTVIGQLDHAEIWNSDKWRAYNDEIDAEVVAADVEDIDF